MRWPDLPLGEAGKWRSGGTPSTTNPDYWGGAIPWISSGSLIGTRLSDSERRLTPEGAANGTSLVDEGAILFVVRGMSLKSEFRVGRSMRRLAFGQDCKAIVVDRAKFQPEYLTYALKALEPVILGMVDEAGHGTGRLDTGLMESLEVPKPDLATQTAIADVLGALDDKIAANERVRRAVGELSSVLFASATRDSRTARLGDCAKLNERTLKPSSGSIRYLDISSVGVGEFAQPIEFAWSEAPGRARRGVQNGDIIWSTVRPERRSHALILDPPDDLVCSTGLITITPTKVGSAFLYEATRTQEFVDFLVAGSTGSAYPATNAAVFLEAPIPLPDATVLGEFEAQMGPAWRRAAVAAEESRRLAATRDALLPELMSGRLKVKGIAEGASE